MRRFRIPASWTTLRFAICLVAAFAIIAPAPAAAWDFEVDSTEDARDADLNDGRCVAINGRCTLRAAVEQANYLNTSSYMFTIGLNTGIYSLKSQLAFKAPITIYGKGDQATVINCQNVAYTLANLEVLQLHDLKLWQCPGTENRGSLDLHSVRVENSAGPSAIRNYGVFTAFSSTLAGNYADLNAPGGAALYNATSGSAVLLSSHFEGNLASRDGGVIHNLGHLEISVCRFVQNAAGSRGGAIYNRGELRVELATFDGNEGSDGGAIYHSLGQALVTQSGFVRNNVGGAGGAIWSSAPLQLVNSTVSGNQATFGGGLYGAGEANALYLANSTITQNSVSSYERPTIVKGGGLYGAAILRNTILAQNKNISGSGLDCYAGLYSQSLSEGNNIIGVVDGCGLSLSQSDSAGSTRRPLFPRLLPLDETTWYPPFHPLDASSPAVDHGNTRGCRMPLTQVLLRADQIERTRHQGTACDAGAIESPY